MKNLLEILSDYNIWYKKKLPEGIKREFYLEKLNKLSGNKLIKVITGQRRTGKSFIIRQFINFLANQHKVNPKNIFYLNKEIVAFDQIDDYHKLTELFNLYLNNIASKGKVYVFLDEVQQIKGWEKFVVSYAQDFTREFEIFITGSNSNLLSTELATLLSGRYVEMQVFPYSYKEFLYIKAQPLYRSSFIEFLRYGSLPELFNLNTSEARFHYLESLRDTIILRDIVQHYAIKDMPLLDSIFKFLALNIGNITSAAKIVKYLASEGKKVNYQTVADYLDYITYTLTFHKAERIHIKTKALLKRESKFYLNDLSFRHGLLGDYYFNPGAALENYVYLTLRRFDYKVFVGTLRDAEIDFIAQKGDNLLYFQVAYIIERQETMNREVGNLLKVKDAYPKILVSLDDFELGILQGIRHVRAFDLEFFLDKYQ